MTKSMTDWGECPACQRMKPLSGRGVMREHRRWVSALRGEWSETGGAMEHCEGSGKPPTEVARAVGEDREAAGRPVQTVDPGDVL
jgi:hypothetical protein